MRRTPTPTPANDETTVLAGDAMPVAGGAAPGRTGAAGPDGALGTLGQGGAPASLSAEPQLPEAVIARVRRHGRHLALPVLLLMVVAAASGFFIGALPETWMNLAAAALAALLAIVGGIGPILGWLARRSVVTNRRVIVHHGFFVRHRSEVSLARVREVRSKQNPIQRVWGSGDIDLVVGTEATRIHDAPRSNELHAALRELSEQSYDERMRTVGFGF